MSYLPDGVCDQTGSRDASQFALDAPSVVCLWLAELLWSQRGLEVLAVEFEDLCYLFLAQLFAVLYRSSGAGTSWPAKLTAGIRREPCSVAVALEKVGNTSSLRESDENNAM